MPLRGNTESFSLSDLIQTLYSNHFSGTLKITNQNTTKAIFFQKGEIHLLSWPQNRNIRLGSILVKQRKITEAELEQALDLQRDSSKRLGEILIGEGILDEEEIHAAVREKLEEEVYEIFTWDKAYFEFNRDQYPPEFMEGEPGITRLRFNVHNLLLEGMRRADEWKILRQRIPSEDVIFDQVERSDPLPELPSRTEEIYNLADGRRKIDQLLEDSSLGKFEVFSSLNRLLKEDLIRPLEAEEAQTRLRESLRGGDFTQALLYGETYCGLKDRGDPQAARLINTILSERDFTEASEVHRLSLYAEKEELASLLKTLLLKRHTGTILLSTENRKKFFQISPKEIKVYDTSPNESLRLGQVLVRQKKMKRSQVDYCVTLHKLERQKNFLGSIMEREGFISSKELEQALRDKILEDLAEVLLWSDTYFSFRKNDLRPPQLSQHSYYSCPWGEDFHRQLVRSLTLWEDLLRRVSHPDIIFTTADSQGNPTLDWESGQILDLINGQRSVQDLFQLVHFSQIALFQMLYRLLNKGYIRTFTPSELDDKIEEALSLQNPNLAIKFCQSAFEQTRDKAYLERLSEIQKMDRSLMADRREYHLEGDLFTFPLRELFQIIHRNGQSGTFTMWTAEKSRTIFFKQGNIFVIYLQDRPEDRRDLMRLSDSEVEYFYPEEEKVQNDLLELFHWKNARFRFLANVFPEFCYTREAEDYMYHFDTPSLMMESIKQIEAFELLCPSLPSLNYIVSEVKWDRLDDETLRETIESFRELYTILDIYNRSPSKDISQLVLKLEDLLEEGTLVLMDEEEARRRLKEKDYNSLEEALKLFQHVQILNPDEKTIAGLQEIVEHLVREEKHREILPERKLDRREVCQLLETLLVKDGSGTLFLFTDDGNLAIYLSKEEVWIYFLDSPPPLSPAITQVTGQNLSSLKEAEHYAQKKNISWGKALEKAQILSKEEVFQVLHNAISTNLLFELSQKEGTMSFHPAFFPIDARKNKEKCLVLEGRLQEILESLLEILSVPHLGSLPISDDLIFEVVNEDFRRENSRARQEASRRNKGSAASTYSRSHVGERDLRKVIDGHCNVGEITRKTRLEKTTVWKLLLQLYKLGEIDLLTVEEAKKKGQSAYMGNQFELAKKYYRHALYLSPDDPNLKKEYERIEKYLGKVG